MFHNIFLYNFFCSKLLTIMSFQLILKYFPVLSSVSLNHLYLLYLAAIFFSLDFFLSTCQIALMSGTSLYIISPPIFLFIYFSLHIISIKFFFLFLTFSLFYISIQAKNGAVVSNFASTAAYWTCCIFNEPLL